jgi:hypothetical protein
VVKSLPGWTGGVDTVCMSGSDPVPPRGAAIGGRVVEIVGWVIVALAAGTVVLQVTKGSVSIAGIVLALFVAITGAAAVAIGRAVEQSRER